MIREVHGSEVREAYNKLDEIVMHLPEGLYVKLCLKGLQFLGITSLDKHEFSDCYALSEEQAKRIDILLGPNAKALFTAWVARQCQS